MSEIVRVLIPDHPDLYGQLGAAIEFGAVLRHANDPLDEGEGEPWRLPAQLTAPELEEALDAAVLHDWHFEVGDDAADTAIGLTHAGIGHMGVYVATATRAQLALLATAAEMLTQAENTTPSQRTPETREIAEFVAECCDTDQTGEYDASLSAWLTVVRVLTLAIATTPASTNRPTKLYNTEGILLPVADTAGTAPAADAALLLDRIDGGGGQSIDLDTAAFQAWQRLTAEWHTAIYGARSSHPDSLLNSFAY